MNKDFTITVGERVKWKGRLFKVMKYLGNLTHVLGQAVDSHEVAELPIFELMHPDATETDSPQTFEIKSQDILAVDPVRREKAEERIAILKPLLDEGVTDKKIIEIAKANGCSRSTIYSWLRNYDGTLSSLMPRKRGFVPGSVTYLEEQVEGLIKHVLDQQYFVEHGISAIEAYREIETLCKIQKLDPPHENTIRHRIRLEASKRGEDMREATENKRNKNKPHRGSIQGADYPLALVQVDHTPLDVMIVDDERQPIEARPYLTLAFDVFSRVVTGFYLTLEKPSNLSLGLCLAHSILPKTEWLAQRGIDVPCPIWGKPKLVHADNAREFHGDMIKMACEEYHFDIQYRALKRPQHGAHIERYLGTLLTRIHSLPGTTYSNPEDKGDYDSAGKAVLTLEELEKWLALQIFGHYHHEKHTGKGMGIPPIEKYKQGLLGDDVNPGRGAQAPIRGADAVKLHLDFMPVNEVTVQPGGIVWDYIWYKGPAIYPWIGKKDATNPRKSLKFIARRDPRNLSVIYFYDPKLEQYFAIPYANPARPKCSIWAWNKARNATPVPKRDENTIFKTYAEQRSLVENAKKKTAAARRQKQREREYDKVQPLDVPSAPPGEETPEDPFLIDIKPFDD